jgi:hypothetical protein
MAYKYLRDLLTRAAEESVKCNYDQVVFLANEIIGTLEIANNSEADPEEALTLRTSATRMIGAVAWRRGNNSLALEKFSAALSLSEAANDKAGIAKAMSSI